MTFIAEVPDQGIKVIKFVDEPDFKFFCEQVGNFVKSFQSAIFIDHGFREAVVSVEYGAHIVGFR